MADFDEVGRHDAGSQALAQRGTSTFLPPGSELAPNPKRQACSGLLISGLLPGREPPPPCTQIPLRDLCIGASPAERLAQWQSRTNQWPATQAGDFCFLWRKGHRCYRSPAEVPAGLEKGLPSPCSLGMRSGQAKPTWLLAKPVSQGPHPFLSKS